MRSSCLKINNKYMNQELYCPNCKDVVESDATYCGNCGYQLKVPRLSKNGNRFFNSYAIRYPHKREHWASNSLIIGIIAIAASLILPILGLILAIIAIIMASLSLRTSNIKFRIFGSIFSAIAILIVIGTLIMAKQNSSINQNSSSIIVATPCYKIKISSEFTVNNPPNSCNIKFYYGNSYNSATDLFTINSQLINNLSTNQFNLKMPSIIKRNIDNNIKGVNFFDSLGIVFDKSPAYLVNGYSLSKNITVTETSILHNNSLNKDNLFNVVQLQVGKNTKLTNLSKSWIWNY